MAKRERKVEQLIMKRRVRVKVDGPRYEGSVLSDIT